MTATTTQAAERPVAEPKLGPSASGSVVLDLGPGQGALVLHTPPEYDGGAIQISPLPGSPGRPGPGQRTHSLVRPRQTASGVLYAAVYPSLPAGDYEVLGEDACVLTVTVRGGSVCMATWPGAE